MGGFRHDLNTETKKPENSLALGKFSIINRTRHATALSDFVSYWTVTRVSKALTH